jgi:hypothetical protein
MENDLSLEGEGEDEAEPSLISRGSLICQVTLIFCISGLK